MTMTQYYGGIFFDQMRHWLLHCSVLHVFGKFFSGYRLMCWLQQFYIHSKRKKNILHWEVTQTITLKVKDFCCNWSINHQFNHLQCTLEVHWQYNKKKGEKDNMLPFSSFLGLCYKGEPFYFSQILCFLDEKSNSKYSVKLNLVIFLISPW